jgi:uroporphyrinogen decarboxylase
MNRRDRLVRALRGEPVDAVPVWLMRQAGRHLPGYRELRARHSILEIARTPSLAAEVTLEPLERFDLDAAVVFADITIPFFGLGVEFTIDPGVGPVIATPVRDGAGVDALREFEADRDAGFVGRAIRAFEERRPDRPIIGFAGAPFTLASYLIEGRPSKEFAETRRMLNGDPALFGRLLDRLTEATVRYLTMQARAGADALQLFDTWVGQLSRSAFESVVLPRLRTVFDALAPLNVPTIYFGTGHAHVLDLAATAHASALGVDWRLPLGEVRRLAGPGLALQGNLDPTALLTDPPTVRRMAKEVLDQLPDGRGHVFNLGHGVPPDARPECVDALVEFVHAYSSERRGAA